MIITPQEIAVFWTSVLADNQRVITVWADGTWKVWNAMDAFYSQTDPDYLVTVSLSDIAKEALQKAGLA